MDVRTTLEIIVAAYLLGWIALVGTTDDRVRGWEWAMLLFWPVLVPVFVVVNRWRHWRYTCPQCKGYYGNRTLYMRHTINGSLCVRRAGER